jgi:hypothetical protein
VNYKNSDRVRAGNPSESPENIKPPLSADKVENLELSIVISTCPSEYIKPPSLVALAILIDMFLTINIPFLRYIPAPFYNDSMPEINLSSFLLIVILMYFTY